MGKGSMLLIFADLPTLPNHLKIIDKTSFRKKKLLYNRFVDVTL